jgi:ribosomal protein S18 acetylase RimI-like enzyme
MTITLRDEQPEDDLFLLQVYGSTRAYEMAMVPWTDEQKAAFVTQQFQAQRSYYRERKPDAQYQVILEDDERVGRLYVDREDAPIHIMDITVLPQYRKRGIGTYLMKKILEEATVSRRRVEIYVETFTGFVAFFEALGFTRKAEEGINYLMEWTPPGTIS